MKDLLKEGKQMLIFLIVCMLSITINLIISLKIIHKNYNTYGYIDIEDLAAMIAFSFVPILGTFVLIVYAINQGVIPDRIYSKKKE